MRSPRRGFGRQPHICCCTMCRFAFYCIKSTFNLIAQEHICVRCNEMEQSDISLQRISICDVLRSETEQNMGERSAASEPHILCSYNTNIR